jgi:hypothetical protein
MRPAKDIGVADRAARVFNQAALRICEQHVYRALSQSGGDFRLMIHLFHSQILYQPRRSEYNRFEGLGNRAMVRGVSAGDFGGSWCRIKPFCECAEQCCKVTQRHPCHPVR